MRAWFERRYLDLLGSIYVYNEHRGYTAIDRVLEAVRRRWPEDAALIAKVTNTAPTCSYSWKILPEEVPESGSNLAIWAE